MGQRLWELEMEVWKHEEKVVREMAEMEWLVGGVENSLRR
jgi:hypothetical protein